MTADRNRRPRLLARLALCCALLPALSACATEALWDWADHGHGPHRAAAIALTPVAVAFDVAFAAAYVGAVVGASHHGHSHVHIDCD